MVKAILRVGAAPNLVDEIAENSPDGGTGCCNEDTQKGREQAPIGTREGQSGATNNTVRPVDPRASIDICAHGLRHDGITYKTGKRVPVQ